jgi:hypothetical protein
MYSQIRLDLVRLSQQELRTDAARARLAAESRRSRRGSRRGLDRSRTKLAPVFAHRVDSSGRRAVPAVPGAFTDTPQQ